MANGYGKAVGGIKVFGHFFEIQQPLQHEGYLFLGGCSFAGDTLLDFAGGVFKDRDLLRECGCHGDTLCPSQFKHRLHVLSEEGCLKRNFVGMVLRDQ